MENIKTLDMWHKSGIDTFNKFCKPGDLVDEDIAMEFANCVPPVTFNSSMIQCGEPYSHVDDPDTGKWKPTFATFTRSGENWKYCGTCFAGKTENKERE